MRVAAPAKTNLRLRVLAREESGFHQLETVFCALGLHDVLELELTGTGIDVDVTGAELGPRQQNLAARAAAAFFGALGRSGGVRISLDKRIPVSAGLGGGSSDASAVLAALDELHGSPLGRARLLDLAATLGSDVPFFLCGSPLALAWGRGERLLALPPLPPRPVLIVDPGFPIATAGAYRELDRARGGVASTPGIIALGALADWDGIARLALNDFEAPTFAAHPLLGELKEALLADGARIALLSGSGSALVGVFDDPADAAGAGRTLARRSGVRILETTTVAAVETGPRDR